MTVTWSDPIVTWGDKHWSWAGSSCYAPTAPTVTSWTDPAEAATTWIDSADPTLSVWVDPGAPIPPPPVDIDYWNGTTYWDEVSDPWDAAPV